MRILFFSTWFPYPPDNDSKIRVYYLLPDLRDAALGQWGRMGPDVVAICHPQNRQ